jgi:hypothetical protein
VTYNIIVGSRRGFERQLGGSYAATTSYVYLWIQLWLHHRLYNQRAVVMCHGRSTIFTQTQSFSDAVTAAHRLPFGPLLICSGPLSQTVFSPVFSYFIYYLFCLAINSKHFPALSPLSLCRRSVYIFLTPKPTFYVFTRTRNISNQEVAGIQTPGILVRFPCFPFLCIMTGFFFFPVRFDRMKFLF